MFLGFLPQQIQKAWLWQYQAHIAGNRLHNNSGDFLTLLGKDSLEGFCIVIWNGDGVLGRARSYTRAIRHAEGCHAAAGLYQQAVTMTVIAADKLYDLVAAGIATSQPQCTHGGLSAGVYHTDNLNGWIYLHNLLGQLGLNQGRCTIAGATGSSLLESLYYLWMGMSYHHRPPGAYIVDVVIAVNIVDMATLCPGNKGRIAVHASIGSDRAVYATWHEIFCFCKGSSRFFQIQHLFSSQLLALEPLGCINGMIGNDNIRASTLHAGKGL